MLASLADLIRVMHDMQQQQIHDAYQKGHTVGLMVAGLFAALVLLAFLATREKK